MCVSEWVSEWVWVCSLWAPFFLSTVRVCECVCLRCTVALICMTSHLASYLAWRAINELAQTWTHKFCTGTTGQKKKGSRAPEFGCLFYKKTTRKIWFELAVCCLCLLARATDFGSPYNLLFQFFYSHQRLFSLSFTLHQTPTLPHSHLFHIKISRWQLISASPFHISSSPLLIYLFPSSIFRHSHSHSHTRTDVWCLQKGKKSCALKLPGCVWCCCFCCCRWLSHTLSPSVVGAIRV